MMEYLVSKHPGPRHLDHQFTPTLMSLFDSDLDGEKPPQHVFVPDLRASPDIKRKSSELASIQPEKSTAVEEDVIYEAQHYGTALHFSVRSVKYPAVKVLLEAGA